MIFLRLYIIGIGRGGQELEDLTESLTTHRTSLSRVDSQGRHAVKVAMHEKKKGHGPKLPKCPTVRVQWLGVCNRQK